MKQVSDKRLIFLDPSEIIPPKSRREENDRYRLFLLSESIRENGLLIPVTVCRTEYGYEVISGERRIKASILAGLKRIPCIVSNFDGDPELFRAAECLLGHQRDASEDADRLRELCCKYSHSFVATLLSFTTGELSKIIEQNQKGEEEEKLNLEELKTQEITQMTTTKKQGKRLPPIKDARFLINSVKQLTESVSSAGIPISFKQKETEKTLEIRIRIEKNSVMSQMSLL